MKNQESWESQLKARLDSVDPVASEPMPAGWSRRNWVQREAVAFAGFPLASPALDAVDD